MNCLDHKGCEGCQWRSIEDGGFCKMFRDNPGELPCAQHDQFDGIRRAFSKSKMATILLAGIMFGQIK